MPLIAFMFYLLDTYLESLKIYLIGIGQTR